MNTPIEPPPKRGMGCFGKGCVSLMVFAILVVVVGVGGTYWGLRHVYLSDKPAPISETTARTDTSAATLGDTSLRPTERKKCRGSQTHGHDEESSARS